MRQRERSRSDRLFSTDVTPSETHSDQRHQSCGNLNRAIPPNERAKRSTDFLGRIGVALRATTMKGTERTGIASWRVPALVGWAWQSVMIHFSSLPTAGELMSSDHMGDRQNQKAAKQPSMSRDP